MLHRINVFLLTVMVFVSVSSFADITIAPPTHLRTEYMRNPLGIDVSNPRFGWWMHHTERNQMQTAYQIKLMEWSADRENLQEDVMWDSGKVMSDNCVDVPYQGPPLKSFTRYMWKVRVWDRQGRPSEWSIPAWFETALMHQEDFTPCWIRGIADEKPSNGFTTEPISGKNVARREEWVAIELPNPEKVQTIILYTARPYNWIHDDPGYGFPLRYKVEVALQPDFSDAKIITDRTREDQPNPGVTPVKIKLDKPLKFKYIRLTATRLYQNEKKQSQLALAEIELLSPEGKNVATNCRVFASGSHEGDGWSTRFLVDGVRVSRGEKQYSPLLRKVFSVKKTIASARAYVSGLGYYELYLNGHRVGDHVLDPANTVHEKRTLYSVYDVTDLLIQGDNCVGMMLGHGWYKKTCAAWLLLRIVFDDGTVENVQTDKSWTTASGPIVYENLYNGEIYDARLQPGTEPLAWTYPMFKAVSWRPVHRYENPPAGMACQSMPPIRVTGIRKPVSIHKQSNGKYIVDFGQNLTGWVHLRIPVNGRKGMSITIRHAEILHPDGSLNTDNLRDARATDVYITRGNSLEEYSPRFTQHGFRYAEITGFPGELKPENVTACIVHTDFKTIGHFQSSSPFLNAVRDITLWSIRGNNMSIPTDCPQRNERMGWMGDAHLAAEPTMLTYDSAAYYENWLRVIANSQDAEGHVPDTSPKGYGNQDGSPPWAIAYPLITWYVYRYYGDTRAVSEHYDNIVRWFKTLESKEKNGIVEYCHYGDWVGLEKTPGPLISTGCYYWTARILSEFAGVLDKKEDAIKYQKKAEQIALAFQRHFYHDDSDSYGNNSQFSLIWPLYLGITPPSLRGKVVHSLENEIEKRKGHLATGILGTKYLFPVLTEENLTERAYEIVFQQDYPGWGYMLNHGATTLWELWHEKTDRSMDSHNHQMFGSILGWFYDTVGGIHTLPQAGFRHFVIAPVPDERLESASDVLETVRGEIRCAWRKNERDFFMTVTIPPDTTAEVIVPPYRDRKILLMDGKEVQNAKRLPTGGVMFDLGSGTYTFSWKW